MPFFPVQTGTIPETLRLMRNRELPWKQFAIYSDSLASQLLQEVVRRTGVHEAEELVVVPIFRSGIAFSPALRTYLPNARVGWVGLERKELPEKRVEIQHYYAKFPDVDPLTSRWIVIDPMLATGASMKVVIDDLIARGVPAAHIIAVVCIAAPEALTLFEQQPWGSSVSIYGAALDEGLDGQCYIVPGLGDYGDRYFGTKSGSGLCPVRKPVREEQQPLYRYV